MWLDYEEKQRLELKELELDLLDNLAMAVTWIFRYHEKTKTDIPNLDSLRYLISKVNLLMKKLYPSDESYHPDGDDDTRRQGNSTC
jgi:hypothetical protein